MVWTVNTPEEMVEVSEPWVTIYRLNLIPLYCQACRWGVDAVLTDHTKTWLDLRDSLKGMLNSPSHGGRR